MSTARFDGDSFLVTADAEGNSRQTVTQTAVGFLEWDNYLDRVRRHHGRHSVDVTGYGEAVMIVRNPGGYVGHHRRLYGCDPEGWPDGLVHWSTTTQQWMRVNGYTDEPL